MGHGIRLQLAKWLFSRGRRKRSVQRALGNSLRDQGDFLGAAKAYESHLDRTPGDFRSWVQLGHMRKETGDFVGAQRAYEAAARIHEQDSDLSLSRGHLAKVRGRHAEAARHYLQSASSGEHPDAFSELESLSLQGLLARKETEALNQLVQSRFQAVAKGISILNLSASGLIEPPRSSRDRTILDFKPQVGKDKFAVLRVFAGFVQPRHSAGRLLADYGQGFHPLGELDLAWDSDRTFKVLIFQPGLRTLRWIVPQLSRLTDRVEIELKAVNDAKVLNANDAQSQAFEQIVSHAQEGVAADAEDQAARTLQAGRFAYSIGSPGLRTPVDADYTHWRRLWVRSTRTPSGSKRIGSRISRPPALSFILPVFDPAIDDLRACLDSMLAQTHPDIQICVADDCSSGSQVRETLAAYAQRDPRVVVSYRPTRGHISAATNTALGLARGRYVMFIDQDDVVTPDCATTVLDAFNARPDARIVYSDEDKLRGDQLANPHMKGSFDPLLLLGQNAVSHACAFDRLLVDELGGCRVGFEGAQDHDLVLRALEAIGRQCIVHVPHVLYHWREIPGSSAAEAGAKPYAQRAMQKAVDGHLERCGFSLTTTLLPTGRLRLTPTSSGPVKTCIVVRHTGQGRIAECLKSLLDLKTAETTITIVSSVAVSDRDREYVNAFGDHIVWINVEDDGAITDAVNTTLLADDGDFGLIIDSSLRLQGRGVLERARALLALPLLGALGGRTIDDDGKVIEFGLTLGLGGRLAASAYMDTPVGAGLNFDKNRLLQEFSAASGALFLNLSAFAGVGGFSKDVAGPACDVDLCLRLRLAGFTIAADPDIIFIGTRGQRIEDVDGPNALSLRTRWGDALGNDPYYPVNFSLERPLKLAHPPRSSTMS